MVDMVDDMIDRSRVYIYRLSTRSFLTCTGIPAPPCTLMDDTTPEDGGADRDVQQDVTRSLWS